ncbi:MAG: hypothetical protein C4617_00110 [Candidatus Liberibacter europaeus]|uniref:Transmembrane protein n=1 Tax=Candidatus Liberibacter europaeus TaxID=744859 RepID=A0A2T4VYN3_9HYPH|nr:hypothetical protein [Candidatus Liberibacter europaeus]PTL86873.1 MAG: hypothetical protein C4617_00110 [Candidatus Liberibacter europaeus]
MVDFISVIQRAIDSLPENTPEMRFKIYGRARNAVARQLDSMKPRPPKEILDRQLRKLEDAILQVERKQQRAFQVEDKKKKRLLVFPNNGINSKNRLLIASRLPISSVLRNIDASKMRSEMPSAQRNRNLLYNFISKNLLYKLRSIFSFQGNSQHKYNQLVVSINADLEHDKTIFRRFNLEQLSSLISTILFSIQKILFNTERFFVSFSTLYDRKIMKFSVVFIMFLGVFMGISYSFSKNRGGGLNIFSSETVDNNIRDKKLFNIRPKITRRLLADGSEIDMGSSNASNIANSSLNNALFTSYSKGDKDSSLHISKSNTLEDVNYVEEGNRVFVNKGYDKFLAVPTNVVWSLQQGLQGLMIKGDISTISNELSASIILKRNVDIALPATHSMEIIFSFPKERQGVSVVDLRQISMRKTEKGPSVLFDSNIFRIAKDSYSILLKDSLDNAKILSEYRLIDIPITYSGGKRVVLTIDKGRIGEDIFKMAISNWEGKN